MAVPSEVARFTPFAYQAAALGVAGAAPGGAGQFVRFRDPTRIVTVSYAYTDLLGKLNPATDSITARIVVLQGQWAIDASLLTPTADLIALAPGGYVLTDFTVHDFGPGLIPAFPSDDGLVADEGIGITIVASPATVLTSQTTYNLVGRIQASAAGVAPIAARRAAAGVRAPLFVGRDLTGLASAGTAAAAQSGGSGQLPLFHGGTEGIPRK
jgi:hypothetical protein